MNWSRSSKLGGGGSDPDALAMRSTVDPTLLLRSPMATGGAFLRFGDVAPSMCAAARFTPACLPALNGGGEPPA